MSDTLEHLASALAGRYALGRELGRGGMATVYAATDAYTGREVAIKVLHRDLTVALGPARFKREIEIASGLDHPHILPVLDSGVAGGSLYLVMPLVTGETLHARLVRERQLSVEEAVRLTREVAGALAFAHECGVVHRDIKPENILLQDGHALVADFGIARATTAPEKLTQTGLSLGTPTYMSPEQAAAEKDLDGRSDQYSLACMLYEMLAGAPPYSAPTAQGLMARHALEAIPSISIVRNTVPEQIEDALYRALAKVPADRFPSVQAFAAALGDADHWGTRRRPPGSRTSTGGFVERRRSRVRRALYSAALSVPMLTAGWAGWRYWLRPPQAAAATTADAAAAVRNIAVLYFDDLSEDRQLAPVADGLTEGLIDALQQVNQLTVVSRNGVLPLRGREIEPDSVARLFKVGTLVSGSVEPTRDGAVKVTVRLTDAQSGADLERATFKQSAGDVLTLRDSLSAKVAELLRTRLGEEVRLRETRAGTSNAEAWTLVQRVGRLRRQADSLWRLSDTAGTARLLGTADSLLVRSAGLDSAWSTPVVERGFVARTRAEMSRAQPLAASRWIDEGLEHAGRALTRNPNDAAALELRGTMRFSRLLFGLTPDPTAGKEAVRMAEQDLRAAVRLEPARAGAWVTLSQLQYRNLKIVEAKLAAQRAYEADAYLSAARDVVWRLFVTSYDLEQAVDADHWCAEGSRRFVDDPRFIRCQLMLMTVRGAQPDVPRAWQLLAQLEERVPKQRWAYEQAMAQIYIGAAVARAGLADSARRVLERARVGPDVDPRGELMGYEAFARVAAGDKDGAVDLLQRYLTAHPEHRPGFGKVNAWWWRDLQGDQRFIELVGTGAR